MLSSLLLIPFLGTLALMVWPGSPSPARLRQITIVILVLQLAMSVVTGIASGVAPARRAAGLEPVEALHTD